jgi:hypothetical protein
MPLHLLIFICLSSAKIEAEIKAKENSGSANVVKYDGGKFKWPTESTRITSPYGDTEGRRTV